VYTLFNDIQADFFNIEWACLLRLSINYGKSEQHLSAVYRIGYYVWQLSTKLYIGVETALELLLPILCLMRSKAEKIIICNKLASWGTVSIMASPNNTFVQFIRLVIMLNNFQKSLYKYCLGVFYFSTYS